LASYRLRRALSYVGWLSGYNGDGLGQLRTTERSAQPVDFALCFTLNARYLFRSDCSCDSSAGLSSLGCSFATARILGRINAADFSLNVALFAWCAATTVASPAPVHSPRRTPRTAVESQSAPRAAAPAYARISQLVYTCVQMRRHRAMSPRRAVRLCPLLPSPHPPPNHIELVRRQRTPPARARSRLNPAPALAIASSLITRALLRTRLKSFLVRPLSDRR